MINTPLSPNHSVAAKTVETFKQSINSPCSSLEASIAAWNYKQNVDTLNKALKHCIWSMGDGDSVSTYAAYYKNPDLKKLVDCLDIPKRSEWVSICEVHNWPIAEPVARPLLGLLEDAFISLEEFQDKMYAEFEKRRTSKDWPYAYSVISLLAKSFPENSEYHDAENATKSQMHEALNTDLLLASSTGKKGKTKFEILNSYRASGVKIEPNTTIIQDALDEESRLRSQNIRERIQSFLGTLKPDSQPVNAAIITELCEIEEETQSQVLNEKQRNELKVEIENLKKKISDKMAGESEPQVNAQADAAIPETKPVNDETKKNTDVVAQAEKEIFELANISSRRRNSTNKSSPTKAPEIEQEIAEIVEETESNVQPLAIETKRKAAAEEIIEITAELEKTPKPKAEIVEPSVQETMLEKAPEPQIEAPIKVPIQPENKTKQSNKQKRKNAVKPKVEKKIEHEKEEAPTPPVIDEPSEPESKSKSKLIFIGCAASLAIGAVGFFFISGGSKPQADLVVENVVEKTTPTTDLLFPELEEKTVEEIVVADTENPVLIEVEELLAQIESIAQNKYSDRNLKEFNLLKSKLVPLLAELKSAEELNRRFAATENIVEQKRAALVAQNDSQILEHIDSLNLKTIDSKVNIGTAAFDEKFVQCLIHQAKIQDLIESTTPLLSEKTELLFSELNRKIEDLQSRHNEQNYLRMAIESSEDLPTYLENLDRLANASDTQEGERRELATLSETVKSWTEKNATQIEVRKALDQVSLNKVEKEIMGSLVDNSVFSDGYVTNKTIHQGRQTSSNATPIYISEWKEPTIKESGGKRSTTYNIRFYDNEGRSQYQLKQSTYVESSDGIGWGMQYEKPTLSAESNYYQTTLNPMLKAMRDKPTQDKPIELIEELAARKDVSIEFKSYFIQELITLMDQSPEKWRGKLAPSLDVFTSKLKGISNEEVQCTLWRSSEKDRSNFVELNEAVDSGLLNNLRNEIKAFDVLFSSLNDVKNELVGLVSFDKKPKIIAGVDQESILWTIDPATKQLERFDESQSISAFAPIIQQRISGLPTNQLLGKIEREYGIDLKKDAYRTKLPKNLVN